MGLRPRRRWGVYSAPPDSLAVGERASRPSPRTLSLPRPSASIFGSSGFRLRRLVVPPKYHYSPQQWGASIHTAYKCKQRSRSFILVPIDSSHTTSYRLSIVTFALGRTVWPQYMTSQTSIDHRRNTVAQARQLVRSAKNQP